MWTTSPGATPLRNANCPSPRNHKLSLATQGWAHKPLPTLEYQLPSSCAGNCSCRAGRASTALLIMRTLPGQGWTRKLHLQIKRPLAAASCTSSSPLPPFLERKAGCLWLLNLSHHSKTHPPSHCMCGFLPATLSLNRRFYFTSPTNSCRFFSPKHLYVMQKT